MSDHGSQETTLTAIPRTGVLQPSFAQDRFWFLSNLHPDAAHYNLRTTYRLDGPLDPERLQRALTTIVCRHEALRTTFTAGTEGAALVIAPPGAWTLPVIDVRRHPDPAAEAQRIAITHSRRPFDLATGPLFRAILLRLHDHHLLTIVAHHAIWDAWSYGIFQRELRTCYEAYARPDAPPVLAPLPIQPADHAAWQRRWLSSAEGERQCAYWRELLTGAPGVFELPTDHPRPAVQGNRGGRVPFIPPREVGPKVTALARAEGTTRFTVLLAAYNVFLSRLGEQHDIVVGMNVLNRGRGVHARRRELEGVIGSFANTAAVRTRLDGALGFTEAIRRTHQAVLGAVSHQELPFMHVVEMLQPRRDTSRTPIYQVMFDLFEDRSSRPYALGDVEVSIEPSEFDEAVDAPMVDLLLNMIAMRGDELAGWMVYDAALFDPASVVRFTQRFEHVLTSALEQPDLAIDALPLMTDEERHQVLVEWNETSCGTPPVRTVPELVARQVARAPDAIAVVDDAIELSYRALDERARRIAGWLASCGVTRGSRVAVSMERTADLVCALLGVMMAGAAYVPIDPSYPPARRAFLREDSGAVLELTDASVRDALASTPDGESCASPSGADAAYVIYTSGSTGRPKGVVVPHSAVINLLASMQRAPGITSSDTLLSVTTLSFDIAGLELYLPLSAGAKVVLAGRDTATDGLLLARLIDARGATIMQATPATWRLLLTAGWHPSPRLRILCGGEALPPDLADALAAECGELWNMYGPTETTVWSTCARILPGARISIGKPIENTRVYVLDAALHPTPIGVPGELCIAGMGVALGYLDRHELTADRFVPDPFATEAGGRMYRTGDRARWLEDGTLEHLGRLDHQVKVRGYRIELGEIESVLLACESVRDAVVVVREDTPGDARLVAYVVPQDAGLDAQELRAVLKTKLPDYMVPSAFVGLSALPLTPNLKVDRKALPAPDFGAAAAEYVAPTDPVEHEIAKIWQDVLAIERVGIHDDFFSLGGHSLGAMQVVARMRASLGVEVPVREVFEAPTLAALARTATARRTSSPGPIETISATLDELRGIERPSTQLVRATTAQEYFWNLTRADPDPAAYAMQVVLRLEGPLDRETLQRSVAAVVARHSVFRTRYHELDRRLFQSVPSELPRFELELVNDPPARESEWGARIDRAVVELTPGLDLPAGRSIVGRLSVLDRDRHALILLVHHAAGDGASVDALVAEIFERYHAIRAGRSTDDRPPVQYIDYADALERFAASPAGRARNEWWRQKLRGAPPLELPVDFPRAEHDARRAAAPFGITPDHMHHPIFQRELPATARGNVIRVARELRTTPYVVYLSGLAWLLHQVTGQDDICIENTHSERAQYRALEHVQGSVTTWLMMRIDVAGCRALRDAIGRTKQMIGEASEHGIISDYYDVVPTPLRRSVFNYVPAGAAGGDPTAELRVLRHARPFPVWKRPWELHLTLIDARSTSYVFWTGIEALLERSTVEALLDRYVGLLESELA